MIVLRLLGDLIYVQKWEETSLKFLRLMARLNRLISFPMEMVMDVGVRSFKVLLEDSGILILRSRMLQVLATNPSPSSAEESGQVLRSPLKVVVPLFFLRG